MFGLTITVVLENHSPEITKRDDKFLKIILLYIFL